MDLQQLVKQRKPVRANFTKSFNNLLPLIEQPSADVDIEAVKVQFKKLERISNDLVVLDKKIMELSLDTAEYESEYDAAEEYREKFDLAFVKFESCLSHGTVVTGHNVNINNSSESLDSIAVEKKKLRLPKIELKKFNGKIKNWLGFWSQFSRIHDDKDIEPEDKFQYLIQSTEMGSRPREIVNSFPATAENYEKAIDCLKSRFGREELLIEFYVREILGLVIKNATDNKKGKIALLYDKLESHLRSLESIGVTCDKYSAMLFPLVESCVPEEILKVWLRNSIPKDSEEGSDYNVKLKSLLNFLKTEVEGEQKICLARSGFKLEMDSFYVKGRNSYNRIPTPTASNLFSGEIKKRTCIFCGKVHESHDCLFAQKMSLSDKKNILFKKKACFRCLRIGHRSNQCKANLKCLICGKSHQTVVCSELPENKGEDLHDVQVDAEQAATLLSRDGSINEVLLQTLFVNLEANGKRKTVRALIDSGSQRSYILRQTAMEMKLRPEGFESLEQALFGGTTLGVQTHNRYQVCLSNIENNFKYNISVLDQQKICGTLPRPCSDSWIKELLKKDIHLSDVGYDSPEIEILIGADFAGGLLTNKAFTMRNGLAVIETLLGWVVMGKDPKRYRDEGHAGVVTSLLVHSPNIEDFWNLEILGIKDPIESKSQEEREAAVFDHFEKTVAVTDEGRYQISLPWNGIVDLSDNREIAEKRLKDTMQKLQRDGHLKDYNRVFEEWEQEGIIEEVPEEDMTRQCYYMPHRAVVKPNSTTKIRPVFDASSKKKGCLSLNDCLEKGMNTLELIPSVLLRFREKQYGISGDIKRAFLQISVEKEDRDFLRFLWKRPETEEQIIFRHRRVVFGVNCSPFLLGAVINHHLERVPSSLQSTADQLKRSFYVDNCLVSVDTIEDICKFIREATEVMSLAKFELRGWINSCDKDSDLVENVLGLLWNISDDTLSIHLPELGNHPFATKREILSIMQKVFDPIGFTGPTTLPLKMLLQATWKQKLNWDENLPPDLRDGFEKWMNEFPVLAEIRIPRCVNPINFRNAIGLHTFCDASKTAYAAVVFLRSEDADGNVYIQLLQSKSRVAPIRKNTIPRLELMACCIGVRLTTSVLLAIGKPILTHYWTDSTTALYWIKNEQPWAVFVHNRVKEIRGSSRMEDWHHVPGEINPADLPSRGCTPATLVTSRWWEGPDWLKDNEKNWPKKKVNVDLDIVNQERRKLVVTSHSCATKPENSYFLRFSSFLRVIRVTAWILRFIHNARSRENEKTGLRLSLNEIEAAEKRLLKLIQLDAIEGIYLKSLCLFEDKDGILRVKTQLTTRDDSEEFKYPIVLPGNHRIVRIIIEEEHRRLSHAGLTVTLSNLREKYWIIGGRRVVKNVINKCIRCQRYHSKKISTGPVSLPGDRVRDALTFEITGVDLAGPLILRDGKRAWILLFTCAVYRAIHLELIFSLSTNGFLLGFRRFIARRGRPKIMYSDNGTNFVGAVNLFGTLDWEKIEEQSSTLRIEWKFNPPTAAWWGGWWERLVQMIKKLLRRVLGKASLHYEEMMTILCDCESILNSRPLTCLTEDPNDLTPLTPAMFLQHITNFGVPDLDHLDQVNICKRFRFQQRLREVLRKRFRNEYLGLLVQKPRRNHPHQFSVGDLVFIEVDKVKRMNWPLARIIELYPGKDQKVRVAKLKTAVGEILRPTLRLYPLEMCSSTNLEDASPCGMESDRRSRVRRQMKRPDRLSY